MQEWIIRDYQEKDWPRLMEIHDAARMQELSLAGLEDAFLPLEQAAEREGLFDYTLKVAEQAGEIVGFTAYTSEELAWLYVDPARMRQGIGRKLTAFVLEQTSVRPFSVEVLEGNLLAIRLYEKAGFREVRRCTGQMPGNESFQVTVLQMEYTGIE